MNSNFIASNCKHATYYERAKRIQRERFFFLVFALRDLNGETFRVRVILKAAALMYDIFHTFSWASALKEWIEWISCHFDRFIPSQLSESIDITNLNEQRSKQRKCKTLSNLDTYMDLFRVLFCLNFIISRKFLSSEVEPQCWQD